MKRLLLLLPFLFGACANDKDVDPAQSSTFVRYFNGGNEDAAQSIQQTSDNGYIILANSVIRPSEVSLPYSKIKLIKTDEFGNVVWQKLYPDFASDVPTPGVQLSNAGGALLILADGGYVIVGTDIQSIGSPKLTILTIDGQGNLLNQNTIASASNVTGKAIALNSNGNYLVLGSVNNSTTNNMILAEIDKSTLEPLWFQAYGDGEATLANRLFLDANLTASWGASVKFNNASKVRLVQTPLNSALTSNAAPIGAPGTNQQANDICPYGFGYAVIGTTNEKTGTTVTTGDDDIFYQILTENGSVSTTKSFPIADQTNNEIGNSICSAQDGGLILLGTVQSQGDFGRGEQDYYLIKIDAFGTIQWTKTYGSKFADVGASVIQARDGSYVILGTTQLGGIRTVMMMKINKEGVLE